MRITNNELQIIKTNLKFERQFERNYKDATLRELPIITIPTYRAAVKSVDVSKKPTTVGSSYLSGKMVSKETEP